MMNEERYFDGLGDRTYDQYFPTYRFDDRSVVEKELEISYGNLSSEQRSFSSAAAIAVFFFTGFGTIIFGNFDSLFQSVENVFPINASILVFYSVVFLSALLVVRYFAERRASVVFSMRKVIVLRRMLGLTYGAVRMVLPNWRVEGADEPFSIKLFPGWLSVGNFPFLTIILVAFFIFLWTTGHTLLICNDRYFIFIDSSFQIFLVSFSFSSVLCLILAIFYRSALFEYHENWVLVFAKIISLVLRVKLSKNFELTIYRAKLASAEVQRIGINDSVLRDFAIEIEDRNFFHHHGITVGGMYRVLKTVFKKGYRSGGSTITQQLVRSLFIDTRSPVVTRKLVEILLAIWIEISLSKVEILGTYLAAVRFDHGVNGCDKAMRHFFGCISEEVSPSQAFFLIERLANVNAKILVDRISNNVKNCLKRGLINENDVNDIILLYQDSVDKGLINESSYGDVSSLRDKMSQVLKLNRTD